VELGKDGKSFLLESLPGAHASSSEVVKEKAGNKAGQADRRLEHDTVE
jgi:hypothetical protein